MIKACELADSNSCLNRAMSDEMIFVLLARDRAAPAAIRSWVDERIRIGKNKRADPEIIQALVAAQEMERDYVRVRLSLNAGEAAG
jgi:hypothetical protein